MKATLNRKDVENIDKWLKRKGFNYIDVRYELLDHLVTEYEEIENYPDLESFLKERLAWCKNVEKEKQKAINFGTTKALFKHFFKLFTNVKWVVSLLLFATILIYLESMVTLVVFRETLFFIYVAIIGYQLYLMIFSGFGSKLKKEAISVVYLINIFYLSQLPLQFISMFPEDWRELQMFYVPYLSFGILLSLNAILFFHKRREELLRSLKLLKH